MKTFTKIVATIGPASFDPKVIDSLIKSGVAVARLNLAHGSLEEHKMLIGRIRQIAKQNNKEIGIILDLPGPKVRLEKLAEDLDITKSHVVVLFSDKANGTIPRGVHLKIPEIIMNNLKPKSVVAIDDGNVLLLIKTVKKSYATASVISGGKISSHKGISILGFDLPLPAITASDKSALSLSTLVDFVAVSFIKNANQLKLFKNELKTHFKKDSTLPLVISKIETASAIKNIDEIINFSDILMVARGDLGLAVPPATLGVLQKDIIKKSRVARKPVIVATQVLNSIMINPLPTRAEILDGTNAVIDGADAIMLSGETASGKFPKQAASFLSHIAKATEDSIYNNVKIESLGNKKTSPEHLLVHILNDYVKKYKIKFILNETADLDVMNLLSSHRIEATQLVPVKKDSDARRLSLWWGVNSFKSGSDPVKQIKKDKILPKGTQILAVGYHVVENLKNAFIRIVKI